MRKQFLLDFVLTVVGSQSDFEGCLLVVTLRSILNASFTIKITNIYAPNAPPGHKQFFRETVTKYMD